MQRFPHVLSEFEEINSLLYKPLNSTHRIKYTCFNASPNYIVLGSTSGSLYLFSREPCSFLQLIPLSDGAVSRVSISPDEKTIALATIRGSVCLVALKPTPKLFAVSTEHMYEQISSLCWNDNGSEVYVGDGAGKVSVMVVSIFTVNGMFQAPACPLMNLDSAVVQLSFSAPLLLISTLTRCYICDTVQEQYKQIGNKGRNGEFGAYFYKMYLNGNKNASPEQKGERSVNRKRSFSFIPEIESNVQEEIPVKIFCARPGSRLWEVSSNGIVMKTHQFKEALGVPPTVICKKSTNRSSRNTGEGGCENAGERSEEEKWSPQSINFSHLFVVSERYLFSYTSSGLYIINPMTATLTLWSNDYKNISMAETIENRIYLMTYEGEFHCLTFSPLDSLILRLYSKKQYRKCLDTWSSYRSQLDTLISSKETSQICDIADKRENVRDDELSTVLQPVITALQSSLDTAPKKLDSGIVLVHSGSSDLKIEENFKYKSNSKSTMSFQSNKASAEETKETEHSNCPKIVEFAIKRSESDETNHNSGVFNEETDNAGKEVEAGDSNSNQNITRKVQQDLEAIYTIASTIKVSMNEKQLEQIMLDVGEKLTTIRESYEASVEFKTFLYEVMQSSELYYFSTLLENASTQLIVSTNSDLILQQYLKAFVGMNTQSNVRCDCGNEFPVNQCTEPKFLGIGRSLLKKLKEKGNDRCIDICNQVPYMWREYLPVYLEETRTFNELLLRQCLQTRDNIVLSSVLPLLDPKQWSLVVKYFMEIQEGKCLSCGKSVRKAGELRIDWNGVTREIMKKQGPDNALNFLMKLEKTLPNLSIDQSIFQSLVFTKILYQHGVKRAIDFSKSSLESSEFNTICSAKVQDQLVQVLEKDLGRSVSKTVFGSGVHHWGMQIHEKQNFCPACTLSLETPVLLGNGIAIFRCGHAYHVNCIVEKKLTTCTLHS